MRAVMGTRTLLIGIGVAALTIVMSAIAVAQFQQPQDFAPFTMTKEAWNAELSSTGPGTEVFRIEYKDRRNWTVTLLSHSANPAMNGTTWSHEGTGLTVFDAWRSFTRTSTADATVDRWIEPGLFRSMSAVPGWSKVVGPGGTTVLRHVDRITQPSSTASQVVTAVEYDTTSELPVSVSVEKDGKLLQRITYKLTP